MGMGERDGESEQLRLMVNAGETEEKLLVPFWGSCQAGEQNDDVMLSLLAAILTVSY